MTQEEFQKIENLVSELDTASDLLSQFDSTTDLYISPYDGLKSPITIDLRDLIESTVREYINTLQRQFDNIQVKL